MGFFLFGRFFYIVCRLQSGHLPESCREGGIGFIPDAFRYGCNGVLAVSVGAVQFPAGFTDAPLREQGIEVFAIALVDHLRNDLVAIPRERGEPTKGKDFSLLPAVASSGLSGAEEGWGALASSPVSNIS